MGNKVYKSTNHFTNYAISNGNQPVFGMVRDNVVIYGMEDDTGVYTYKLSQEKSEEKLFFFYRL